MSMFGNWPRRRNRTTAAPPTLAQALTERTHRLCRGLEYGEAGIFALVTPVTAELLRWWFGTTACLGRPLNFHPLQKLAILNTVVAHEALCASSLMVLYDSVMPAAQLNDERRAELSAPWHAHPKYCLALNTGQTGVLLALLTWQLLNSGTAQGEAIDDPRFTRRFLLVAPDLAGYDGLLDTFCGRSQAGVRDFATSSIAALAGLLAPETLRGEVLSFARHHVHQRREIGRKSAAAGMIGIVNRQLLSDAATLAAKTGTRSLRRGLSMMAPPADPEPPPAVVASNGRRGTFRYLAHLPDLMVFSGGVHCEADLGPQGLTRIAETKGRRFTQVDFFDILYEPADGRTIRNRRYVPHLILDANLGTPLASLAPGQ